MSVDVTARVLIEGASTLSGSIPLKEYIAQLLTQPRVQRIETEVLPADVDLEVAIPQPGTQTLLFVFTDLPVSLKLNGIGATPFTLPTNGCLLVIGGPDTTSIFFTGSGSPKANVVIMYVGG